MDVIQRRSLDILHATFKQALFLLEFVQMSQNKKILLSGVKPTGRPHIGNYFGAMRQFAELQNKYQSFFMIADLHSLTSPEVQKNPKQLEEDTLGVAMDYLAIGLDPKKSIIFKQSDVVAHTELTWIFDCLTTMPYLMRAHAFKDAEARNKEINVGVFNYPMLMSSDVLLYNADVVPVGKDQEQHIEIARDTASKFNNLYGETFKLPEALVVESAAVVPGIDGQKMSKSYGNTIPLFATDEEIDKAVAGIVTDSKGVDEPKDPAGDNIFTLYRLFATVEEQNTLAEKYRKGGMGYKEAKDELKKKLKEFITPLREKRQKIEKNRNKVKKILESGGKKARKVAEVKMKEVKSKVGLNNSN